MRSNMVKIFLLCWGLIAVILIVPGYAEETFTMQLPANPVFTYRVTNNNQLIKPSPLVLRFARSESGLFCSKIVQVGINTGSLQYSVGGPAPGTSDPNAVLYTSSIGGGAALCNFNYNDTLVTVAVPPYFDALVVKFLQGCLSNPPFPDPGNAAAGAQLWVPPARREAKTYGQGSITFKPFLKKNGGEYEWKAVTSSNSYVTCDSKTPFECKIKVEAICDAIPNRAPAVESITITPASVPAGGGPIKITMIANDDTGVRTVIMKSNLAGVFPPLNDVKYGSDVIYLKRTAGLGRTVLGDNRSQWEAAGTVPPNTSTAPRTIAFASHVFDGEGTFMKQTDLEGANAQMLQQAGNPDRTPPQILGVTVTPQTLPATGGIVAVSVRASDNVGVNSVMINLTRQDGQNSLMQVPLVSGSAVNGEWRNAFNLPANTVTSSLVYNVKVTVSDANKNTATSQSFPITMAGAGLRVFQPQPPLPAGTAIPTRPTIR